MFVLIVLIVRRSWTVEETRALLQCYKGRKDEMNSRKQKFAYDNVLKDLNAMQILKAPTTALNLQAKIASLLKSYHLSLANQRKSVYKFKAEMDEIFGGDETLTGKDAQEKQSSNRTWSDTETQAFLRCYESRKEEMLHPTKKKFAYDNILEDLISMNVLKAPTTSGNLETKMASLLKAYKAARDNERLTGRGASTFQYLSLMDEIYGDRPIMANNHTINLFGDEVQALVLQPKKVTADEIGEQLLEERTIAGFDGYFGLNDDEILHELDREDVSVTAAPHCENSIVIDDDDPTEMEITDTAAVSINGASPVTPNTASKSAVSHNRISNAAADNSSAVSSSVILQQNISGAAAANCRNIKSSSGLSRNVVRETPVSAESSRNVPRNVPLDGPSHSVALKAVFSQQESNATAAKTRAVNKEPSKKKPFSFKRTKTVKEIVQEKKLNWEKAKIDRKEDHQMKILRIAEESKQQRHQERLALMSQILEKL